MAQTSRSAGATAPDTQSLSRREVTRIIANTRRIVSPNGIEALVPVEINGAKEWLSIRGTDRRNPILLFLHGGPGSPTMPDDYTFQRPWEDYFTVVQWDQRGTGKTYASNNARALASSMTLEQMTSDAEAVVRYLQAHYDKTKIFLLGHSWGSVLGVALAQRHPDWFYAYLGIGQIVNMRQSEAGGYQFALDEARAHHNRTAERQLLAIAPYPSDSGTISLHAITVQRKWLMYYGGLTFGRRSFAYDADAWLLSPDYTQRDLDVVDKGGLYSLKYLLKPLGAIAYDSVTTFQCPVVLFVGRHDYTTSHDLAAEWFDRIQAPSKRLVWFANSAHMIMQEEPGRFLYHLITDLRPFAAAAGDVAPGDDSRDADSVLTHHAVTNPGPEPTAPSTTR